jgi:hypothetical protein
MKILINRGYLNNKTDFNEPLKNLHCQKMLQKFSINDYQILRGKKC